MGKALAICAAALGLQLGAGATLAASASPPSEVDGVRTHELSTGQTEIRVLLDHPLSAAPTGFRVLDPDPMIVLDLAHARRPRYEEDVKVDTGPVRDVQMAQEGDGVRLVVRLDNPEPYRAYVDGKALRIVVGAGRPRP